MGLPTIARLLSLSYVTGFLLLQLLPTSTAFTANLPYRHDPSGLVAVRNVSPPPRSIHTVLGRMVPLSNEEIFARAAAQRKSAFPDEDDTTAPVMLFDEVMLQDMQTAIMLLDQRAIEGPGSLSMSDIDQLEGLLQKILHEMRINQHLKPQRPSLVSATASAVSSSSSSSGGGGGSSNSNAPALPVETVGAAPKVIDMDTPEDEGTSFGSTGGGMGQAAETTNTYILPGMDQMTAAEYQYELQKAVIAKQNVRRQTLTTGNRSSWDYMNQLTGESGVLKKESSKSTSEPDKDTNKSKSEEDKD
jgi:hypothetical protein